MKRKPIIRRGLIILFSILVLSILPVFRSYFVPEVGYVGYDDRAGETQVLFIGNSYTSFNDFPQLFSNLAQAGGHQVGVTMLAQGGWTLKKHVESPVTWAKLQQHDWDYVVLQEQSVIPAQPNEREKEMYPAVRDLIQEIESLGGKGVLFMTWGRRDGLELSQHADFAAMQAELKAGYLEIGQELDVVVAPVGVAWQHALAKDPSLELWSGDGSHPSRLGSYLAACVFYAVIFEESPEGLDFVAGLPVETASLLQSVAAETVFADLPLWNIE